MKTCEACADMKLRAELFVGEVLMRLSRSPELPESSRRHSVDIVLDALADAGIVVEAPSA